MSCIGFVAVDMRLVTVCMTGAVGGVDTIPIYCQSTRAEIMRVERRSPDRARACMPLFQRA